MGVDEAGRGPLAGPVVVAACVVAEGVRLPADVRLDDSKVMSEEERERAYEALTGAEGVHWAVVEVGHERVDEMNVLRASLWGMDDVVKQLVRRGVCEYVLVDGPYLPPGVAEAFEGKAEAIKGGDGKVRAIAAASIIAKVTRDRIMARMHEKYPLYGFDVHKGYPVPEHRRLLSLHGPCEIHRRSYRPVREAEEKHASKARQEGAAPKAAAAAAAESQSPPTRKRRR